MMENLLIDEYGNKYCSCGVDIPEEEEKCYLCRLLENWHSKLGANSSVREKPDV